MQHGNDKVGSKTTVEDCRYKCPKCNIGYCSVACYKSHKVRKAFNH